MQKKKKKKKGTPRDLSPAGILLGLVPGDDGGFTGGGQIGYNDQIGSFVIGVGTDIHYADTESGIRPCFWPAPALPARFAPGVFSSNAPEWWGSLRARLGFAVDRVLSGTGKKVSGTVKQVRRGNPMVFASR